MENEPGDEFDARLRPAEIEVENAVGGETCGIVG